ncbi:hypothetical protein [Halorubrum lacusprofundi]|uniref:Uncharacterized protein n=2 Tax=Halorubrum lacusprofundi TaxID=2247 RepID=B9LU85_HALLT|nr:hypothetical protein Hlac_2708 [Halorubrum lacusprofundi ATCC 49239]
MTDQEARAREARTQEARVQEAHSQEVPAEACGRCSMTTVVGAVSGDRSAAERTERDPFAGERIEVEESSIRRISPGGILSDLKERFDAIGRRLTYGR